MGNMDNSAENLLQEAKTIIKSNYEAKKIVVGTLIFLVF